MGIVLVEAALSAKPIIASKTGGILEVLSSETAWLFEPGQEDDLLEKLTLVLKNINTPLVKSRTEKLRAEVLRRFDIRQIAKEYGDLYLKNYQK
jgi:glycosyltransferase involved in cell wall biosynthesis